MLLFAINAVKELVALLNSVLNVVLKCNKGNKKETKYRKVFGFFLNPNGLDSAVNFTGTQATSANVYTFNGAVYNCSYLLDIRFPSAFGVSVGVADIVARHCAFTANFADRCHDFPPP